MESPKSKQIDVDATGFEGPERKQSQRPAEWSRISIEEVRLSSPADSWLRACASEQSRQLLEKANRYALASDPVLIAGECGTGKTQLAYHVHRTSQKSAHRLIHVACGNLAASLSTDKTGSETAFCSLLERYARNPDVTWLFEGVDEIPLSFQSFFSGVVDEILRADVCRSHPFVLSTATRDLDDALEEGRFRKDLFYKLNVLQLGIPALRERKADIAPLVAHFLARMRSPQSRPMQFSQEAIAVLSEYHWPGNVVELRNAIAQVCVLADSTLIDSEQLLLHWQFPKRARQSDLFGLNLEEAETHLILEAIARYQGNKTAAAKQLGISTRTLQNKMQKYRRLGFVR